MSVTRSSFPWFLQGTVDPTAAAGVPAPVGFGYQRTTTGDLFMKVGAADTAWLVCSLGASKSQNFLVTQQVGDTATITIDASRGFLGQPTTTYNVTATLGANSLGIGIQGIDPASFGLTSFILQLTSPWAAGDSIMFSVTARS